jgi:hypothetical protein
VGDEIHVLERIHIDKQSNDILRTGNLQAIKDFDIIYVQVNFFEHFCTHILGSFSKKIILMTGQWHLPQLLRSPLTDFAINHPNVAAWVSQNPIYVDHPKYMYFPYGIEYYGLEDYAEVLVSHDGVKTKKFKYLPVSTTTHPSRFSLPVLPKLRPYEYFMQMAASEFIISPIGDRDDCWRHWEAIGLGTVPISNITKELYSQVFADNMVYSTIEEITDIIKKDTFDAPYKEPNKDLICMGYHKKRIDAKIAELKQL